MHGGEKLESVRTLQEKLLKLCSDYINTLENHFMPITDYRVQKERLLSFWCMHEEVYQGGGKQQM